MIVHTNLNRFEILINYEADVIGAEFSSKMALLFLIYIFRVFFYTIYIIRKKLSIRRKFQSGPKLTQLIFNLGRIFESHIIISLILEKN